MKKSVLTPEIMLLLGSFILTGIAVLFIFKPPAKNYIKLIKWSKDSHLETILESSARRMYPIFAESAEVNVILTENSTITPLQVQEIIKKITLVPATSSPEHPNKILLNSDKTASVNLDIKITETDFKTLNPEHYFDTIYFMKFLRKLRNDEETQNYKGYIFALYQTEKQTYTLEILDFTKN